MVGGAFQTSREIFESTIWEDVIKFRIFFYIYGNAVFAKEGTNVAGIHLNRGQYLRSYRNLQNDLAFKEKRSYKIYPLTTLQRKINELVQEKRIEIQGTDYGTLFTVVNYDEYQGFERYEKSLVERNRNGTGTEPEQYRNNNKNVKNVNKLVVDGTENNPVDLWTNLWGFPNGIAQTDLSDWRDQFGDELVNYAITYAGKRNVKPAGADRYLETVFDGWQKLEVTTVEQAQAEAEKHQQRYSNNRGDFSKPKGQVREALPDWADKDYKPSTEKATPEQVAKIKAQIEAQRKGLEDQT